MEALSFNAGAAAFIAPEDMAGWWPEGGAVVRSACRYDVAKYDESLFGVLAIARPEQLQWAVTKRKAEFLAGRYCAQRALVLAGYPNTGIGIGDQRQPLWPDGLRGAISHARQLAIAVVARDSLVHGVGVDVEETLTSDVVAQIQALVLNADEYPLLSHVPWCHEQLVTLIYSVKESFFKAAFPLVRRYFDFDAISLQAIDVSKGECCFQINTPLHPLLWQGRRFRGRFCFPRHSGLDNCNIATLVVLGRAGREILA